MLRKLNSEWNGRGMEEKKKVFGELEKDKNINLEY